MNVRIVVATHKPYRMPDDPMYLPMHVGHIGKKNIGFIGDDTGENISEKNPNYCELTALYWAWKNQKADYIGLAHYRRHFVTVRSPSKWDKVLTHEVLTGLFQRTDIILPSKRNYFIETNYSHYIHAHRREGLDKAIEIIKKDYPDYAPYCDKVMKRTQAHKSLFPAHAGVIRS